MWSVFGQVGYLGVAFITNILLVRILGPYEFGQIGIIMFFVAIGKVLTESGLSGALVRKNDATEEDFSTVFIFNLIISFVLVAVIIVMSGYVADFYKDTSLENILIVSSMVLLIDAFRIPQNAKLVKELKFKKNSISKFDEKPQTGVGWINAGFFVLNKKIFKYLTDTSSMLEREPLSKTVSYTHLTLPTNREV